MEKPPQPHDEERKQKSPLKRQDSQRGSLLSRIAKEAADKGMPGIAKAALHLDNLSPERDKALADLETNPAKKKSFLKELQQPVLETLRRLKKVRQYNNSRAIGKMLLMR